ncbi:MAG: Undecaprenyl-phosphate 4-deoxy-4-formamido-L-arabinose transferase [Verrucomicrobia bacterium ADurb.Bin345]|nr:MAG: Undecaprenyl-phosphate 4-deoxy-4-formamido-L-arabinose transferase [Verrucomicrobia bacterium ADurb.Bin345]
MNDAKPGVDVSVVAPIYNELENVELLCRQLQEALSGTRWSYEIILVDDGSTDGSWEKMVSLTKAISHLRVIRLRRNFGQTAAMSAGFDHARGEYIVTLDADLQNDPKDIPKLLERAEQGYDVVSGWRKDRKDPFINRRLPSMLANKLISKITGVNLHDHGCTLKVYRRDVIRNVRLYGEMHRFIPALASWVGGSIDEVVVTHHPRRFGRSKYGISRTVRVILDLLTVKFLLHYSTGPIQMFGKIGALFMMPGLLMFVVMIAGNLLFRLTGHPNIADNLVKRPFWIMSAFMFIFFGTQFISMGLLAEMQIRTYHESQNKPIYVIKEQAASAG